MAINQYDQLQYAQYQPLSMQEIWAPATEMRQRHDQLQEEYAQQEEQGGRSLLGLDPVKDKAAYDIQQNFITKTKEAADQLATKGFIDSGRRRGLMEVKSLYTNQVVPLQNQLKIRQERAEELRRMQLQDPTFRATANPNDTDLMTGLKNPNAFNYDGVSGNQLYKSVAEKANQLSKIVEQEHPELIKSSLAYQYFTAVKSGANLSQIDKAMRQQFNPADVDKMTNLMHGVVSSTMNEFGVPQKFGNNQKVQDELWQVASQGLYAAAGQTNFGSMHDSYGMQLAAEGRAEARAREAAKKLSDEQAGRGDYDYVGGFDDKELENIQKIKESIETGRKALSGTNKTIDAIAKGRKWQDIPVKDRNVIKDLYKGKDLHNNRLWEINQKLKDYGVDVPAKFKGKGLDDSEFSKFLDDAIVNAEDNYKYANKSILFRDLGDKEIDKINNFLYSNSDNLTNKSGKKVKFGDVTDNGRTIGTPEYVLNKHGFNIKLNKKDGGSEIITGNISDLGSPLIAQYYKQVMAVENDKMNMSDSDFNKKYKTAKSNVDLTENYKALESDIRGRTNTYIASVPVPGN